MIRVDSFRAMFISGSPSKVKRSASKGLDSARLFLSQVASLGDDIDIFGHAVHGFLFIKFFTCRNSVTLYLHAYGND